MNWNKYTEQWVADLGMICQGLTQEEMKQVVLKACKEIFSSWDTKAEDLNGLAQLNSILTVIKEEARQK